MDLGGHAPTTKYVYTYILLCANVVQMFMHVCIVKQEASSDIEAGTCIHPLMSSRESGST